MRKDAVQVHRMLPKLLDAGRPAVSLVRAASTAEGRAGPGMQTGDDWRSERHRGNGRRPGRRDRETDQGGKTGRSERENGTARREGRGRGRRTDRRGSEQPHRREVPRQHSLTVAAAVLHLPLYNGHNNA